MKIQKKTLYQVIGYVLFGFLSFLVFLSLTFPFDLLEQKALRALEAESGCHMTIGRSRFALPAKIFLRDLKARCPKQLFVRGKEGEVTFKLASIDLGLSLLPFLLKGRGEVDIEAALLGGEVSAYLTIEKKEGKEAYHLVAEGKALHLAEVDPGLSGQVALKGEGTWVAQDLSKGVGWLSLNLDQGRFKEVAGWTIPVGEVSFSKIEGRLSMKSGRIMVEKFSAKGEMVDLPMGSGSILLRSPVNRSILNLSLRARPKGRIKEMASLFVQGYTGRDPLKIRIKGLLQTPQISLNGRPFRL